ncbi:phosphatase PAP2 family protein [Corynebacterium uropygiale]|uniref:Phosphatase PAP2 family protein n=1 Tax=Corynebacterium uropygiale TaxID=1775911 RepID=A0A9X1U161_9CORY|nr:phosphatase PAP2 family protein [Corynebacterium uropygiale]MCF4007549.1 phosphatase PAP2 family protein [Corynebacterium uropygiale]
MASSVLAMSALAPGGQQASFPAAGLLPTASAAPNIIANIPALHPPVFHDGAPVPQAFPPEEYRWYLSDISSHPYGIYYSVIDSFPQLREHNPELMERNIDTVSRINHEAAANPALIDRAHEDATAEDEGVLWLFTDAFGQELGGHLRDALRENRLPKTVMLFGGVTARAGGLASSTFVEKEMYNNPRPFIAYPDRIQRYEVPGVETYPNSKSFPSGHTNQATWTTTFLAAMLPELAPQLLARGSEAGYNRLVLGVHYPLDVIGGRMTGTAAAADRWNDPRMRANLEAAAQEIRSELEWRCGDTLANCVARDTPYDANAVQHYSERMSYGFDPVLPTDAPMIVPQAAPDLLINAFPELTYEQRRSVLEQTAGPAGLPLDDQGPAGSWQRLDLARAMSAHVEVLDDGSVRVMDS